jgi:hypothetical protein
MKRYDRHHATRDADVDAPQRNENLEVPPPDENDELSQYEGTYESSGIAPDMGDVYGTGGGDVGIGGDVSPRGTMHDAAEVDSDVREDDEPVYASDETRQDLAERDEDMELSSDEYEEQGDDDAWPRDDDSGEHDPRGTFDDLDAPVTAIREEDELDDLDESAANAHGEDQRDAA